MAPTSFSRRDDGNPRGEKAVCVTYDPRFPVNNGVDWFDRIYIIQRCLLAQMQPNPILPGLASN